MSQPFSKLLCCFSFYLEKITFHIIYKTCRVKPCFMSISSCCILPLNSLSSTYMHVLVYQHCHAKYLRLDGLKYRNAFFHSSGGQKFKIKVLAGLISPKAFVLDSHGVFTVFLLMHIDSLMYLCECKFSLHVRT